MNNDTFLSFDHLEGRTFIIGREGHIYIDSRTASKQHAEISIINGRIFLRDLNSSNGTFLLKNEKLVYFEKGFVNPLQPIVIGSQNYTAKQLLSIAETFVVPDDDADTELNFDKLDKIG